MKYTFKTTGAILTPYHDVWNQNAYVRRDPFCEQPWQMRANSTSGAPVVVGDDFLVGLLRECDAVFAWDGAELTVEAPDDALFVSEDSDEAQRWADYHQSLGIRLRSALFGLMPEYCTWVEQIGVAPKGGGIQNALDALTPALIESYLETVKQAGWPAGRFTVDAGWSPFGGPGGFGDWLPKIGFDMPALADQIRSYGHVPGLWLGPALIARDSLAAIQDPDLVGMPVEMDGECDWTKYYYLNPSERSQELLNELFQRVFDWGFRKFKLDIFYGPKPLMRDLSKQCRVAADRLQEPVELEGHIPDPFCAQYMNVIRINDLMISKAHPGWRKVLEGHLNVCRNSAPGMVLNLDHVGGNCADVDEDLFVEHLHALEEQFDVGYPAVSFLPQHISQGAVNAVTESLK